MNQIQIPGSDIIHSKAVFGTSRLGGTIERFDKKEAIAILKTAFDAGINAFDTADIYAQGNSERLISQAFRNQRDQIVLGTKSGYSLSMKSKILAKIKPLVRTARKLHNRPQTLSDNNGGFVKASGKFRASQMSQNFSRTHLTSALHASLKRLKTDRIDVYQLHSPTGHHLAESDAFETLSDLKDAGKIRAYGASLLSWNDIEYCTGKGASWIQVQSDLVSGVCHQELQKKANADGLVLMARQIFATNILISPDEPAFQPDSPLNSLKELIKSLHHMGDQRNTILRYLHHHSNFPAFLFATTRLTNLKKNLLALNAPPFSEQDLAVFRKILST